MWIIDTMFIDKSVCIDDRNLINYVILTINTGVFETF